ncbi:MAG: hypothetical protein IT546_08900, partial [Caulobacteraceae bacterium]|nr:hypothetical protein [Caulobacteraceae bacterium]
LKQRLSGVASQRGGEVVLVAAMEGREIEVKLPGRFALNPSVRGAWKTAPGVLLVEEM